MKSAWALFLFAFAGIQGPAAAAPVAILCQGYWYEGDPFGESKRKEAQSRRYVVDEPKQLVSYWNEDREVAFPICDRSWQSCEIEFEPTKITAKGELNARFSTFVLMYRRTGFLVHHHFEKSKPAKFWQGDCEPTQMPMAMTEKNKF